jgi:methylated-DNA-[protein]-cysteine S-methyltransferase
MGRAAHHYLILETSAGYCGIAWNKVGITRFQLPAKSADGAQRMLLRRAPGSQTRRARVVVTHKRVV